LIVLSAATAFTVAMVTVAGDHAMSTPGKPPKVFGKHGRRADTPGLDIGICLQADVFASALTVTPLGFPYPSPSRSLAFQAVTLVTPTNGASHPCKGGKPF
jgi:hypothetical protein